MSVLLDTHILLWILTHSPKLKKITWLDTGLPWHLSPISFLEMKFLQECGRIQIDFEKIVSNLKKDNRFIIDDPSLDALCEKAFLLGWTRDPFDRLLVAHSMVRHLPLGTCDGHIREHYSHIF